jgi:hypothetical protein
MRDIVQRWAMHQGPAAMVDRLLLRPMSAKAK